MTISDTRLRPTARTDSEGCLIDADEHILDLMRRAGGAIGMPMPQPEIAALVRLSIRLGIAITRDLVVADGENDCALRIQLVPDRDGATLIIDSRTPRPPWNGSDDRNDRADDFAATLPGWAWETDAALRVNAMPSDAVSEIGSPLDAVFTPMMPAYARQCATMRNGGTPLDVSAMPRSDRSGQFAGLVGRAKPIEREVDAGYFSTGFAEQLDRSLRRPLERIIANASDISDERHGSLAEIYLGYAKDIAQAGRHLLGLIGDLVDVETVDHVDFAVAMDRIELADVARRAAGLLTVQAGRSSVKIESPSIGQVLHAIGDVGRVLQVLINLIGNAIRYSPPEATVWIRCARDKGGRACLVVADQGKGIAFDDQARIFDKFERVDPSEQDGSGLGLYISRRLARAMGGDLTVESTLGQGARFILALPQA